MRLSTRLTIVMVGLVLLTAATAGLLTYRNLESVTRKSELEREQFRVNHLADQLDRYVGNVRADVLVAREAGIVPLLAGADFDEGDTAGNKPRNEDGYRSLVRMFRAQMSAKPHYVQYRLIGVADGGRELIRLDRSGPGGEIRIVPKNQLQRKGQRDYVQNALKLSEGSIYISPIELNLEHGVIEKPHTPVLRAATPVCHPDGKPFGVLVINVDMRRAFQNLRESAREGAHVFVVNQQGHYLAHTDRAREFRFEFGDSQRWQDDLPEFAYRFNGKDTSGVFHDATGDRLFAGATSLRLADERQLVVAETVPYSQLTASAATVRKSVIVAGLCSAFVAVILAVLFARMTARPLERLAASVVGFSGDENVALPATPYRELGELTSAIQTMADEVCRKTEWLRRKALESAPIAIVTVDGEGKIVLVNSMAAEMFGYERDEIVDKPVETLVPLRNAAAHAELRAAYMANPQKRAMAGDRNLIGRRKDGTEFPVEVGLKPIETEKGPFVIGAIADLTERAKLESDLSQANRELEQRTVELFRSNQDLEQFAFVASHDLQEPLRKVATCCQVLAEEYADKLDDQGRDWIDFAVDGATRMRRLVVDLLEFSQVSAPSRSSEPADAAVACKKALENLAEAIKTRGVHVICHPLPLVLATETQLVQLFQNLISNGIKYCKAERPVVEIGANRAGSHWKFFVKDNGIGIAPEFHGRIFQIFQRLHRKEEYSGTGVGLAICRKVVERFNGSMSLESAVGQGSTFSFTLLAADAVDQAGAEVESPAEMSVAVSV